MEWVQTLLQHIFADGAGAVKAVLLLVSAGLGWLYFNELKNSKAERKELIELFQKQIEADRRELIDVIEKVNDRYEENSRRNTEAINEVKVLIAAFGSKL